jgi:glucokinase
MPMSEGAMELYRKIVHDLADTQRALEHAQVVREAFDRHCAARDRETVQQFAVWLDGVDADAFAA